MRDLGHVECFDIVRFEFQNPLETRKCIFGLPYILINKTKVIKGL